MDLYCGELEECIWVTEEYALDMLILRCLRHIQVQKAVRCVALELKTGDQDLGVLSTEKVIKAMLLDITTQGEGSEWRKKN